MNYRVNYGNGQVSQDFKTKKEAFRHRSEMNQYQEFAFIQYWTDGEWFNIGMDKKVRLSLW